METSIAFSISNELVSFFVILPTIVNILLLILIKVVVIHKVITCIVRRININHLHLTQIVFTKQFQHLQVITLYIEVLRVVEIYALFTTRAKGICCWCISQSDSIALVGPSKLITILRAFHDILRQFLAELVKIYSHLRAPFLVLHFRQAVGKQFPNSLDILIHHIRGLHIHFNHILYY